MPSSGCRRRVDVLVCWRRPPCRNLKHLVILLDELQALGVSFVSLNEGIDATTPAGRLQLHVLAALAEFERARIAERVQAGLARARRHGTRLGRPRTKACAQVPLRPAGLHEAARTTKVGRNGKNSAKRIRDWKLAELHML